MAAADSPPATTSDVRLPDVTAGEIVCASDCVCDRRASASCALASTAHLRLSCMCVWALVVSEFEMSDNYGSQKVLLKSLRSA